jgi:hypothetical protein
MPKKAQNGGMWAYLDASGVLEKGTDEEIKKAKKDYRKIYFTQHKRLQRKRKPEFTINFSRENEDYSKIAFSAKQHRMKITTFLRSAVMAYINKTYIVPDRLQVAELEQLLSQCLNEIQIIVKQKERFSYERELKYEVIEKRIEKLESEITQILKCPYTIEELIIKGIEEKPTLKEQLLTILTLNKDDHQNQIS